jgi:hypothetical protein
LHNKKAVKALSAGDKIVNALYDTTGPKITVTGSINREVVKVLAGDHTKFTPTGFNILWLINGFNP